MTEHTSTDWFQEKAIEIIQRAKEDGYTVIKLAGFKLGKLPKELFELEQLVNLDISYNNLKEIPQEIAKLYNLEHLDISGNGVEDLPPEISYLQRLEHLYMYDNSFRSIPDAILKLENLKYLKAQHCKIEFLPQNIHLLKKLECLVLYKNQLRDLPDSFQQLERLRLCYLEENPFINDIENKKPKNRYLVLFNYDKPKQESSNDKLPLPSAAMPAHEVINEARVVILGLPGAGKTTLCRKILDGNSVFRHPGSTEGIDIHKWIFEITSDNIPLIANMWDFGGQEKYESYHPFFLTDEHTVYLVVANGVEENKENLYKWLEIVSKRAPSSPLMVVISKADERKWDNLDEEELQKQFPQLRNTEVLRVSSKTGENIEKLRSKLIDTIKNLPGFYQKSSLGENWRLVYNQINELRRTMPQINASDFDNLCKQMGITNIDQRNAIGRYLHNIGALLYFVDNLRLNHIVVLDMKWAVNGIYHVLDSSILTENNGKFNQREAVEVWKKSKNGEEFPAGTHGYLIELLKNFQFCYELQQGEYIVPDKISLKKPSLTAIVQPPLLRARLQNHERFPQGLLTRLMVKCGSMIDWQHTWQKGMVLHYGDCAAIVELASKQNEIDVTIGKKHSQEKGDDRFAFFQLIRNELYFVCREFGLRDEKLKWMIPCQCLKPADEELCYFEEKKLFQKARLGKNIDCDITGAEESVKSILGAVYSHFEDSWEMTMKGLKRDMKELFKTLQKQSDYDADKHLKEFGEFTSRKDTGEAGKIRQHMINYYVNAHTSDALRDMLRNISIDVEMFIRKTIPEVIAELGDKPTLGVILGYESPIRSVFPEFIHDFKSAVEYRNDEIHTVEIPKYTSEELNKLICMYFRVYLLIFLLRKSPPSNSKEQWFLGAIYLIRHEKRIIASPEVPQKKIIWHLNEGLIGEKVSFTLQKDSSGRFIEEAFPLNDEKTFYNYVADKVILLKEENKNNSMKKNK